MITQCFEVFLKEKGFIENLENSLYIHLYVHCSHMVYTTTANVYMYEVIFLFETAIIYLLHSMYIYFEFCKKKITLNFNIYQVH